MTPQIARWIDFVQNHFHLQNTAIQPASVETLLSPHQLVLSKKFYDEAVQFVEGMYSLSRTSTSELGLTGAALEVAHKDPKSSSVLMAYDFHVLPETGAMKLIEINTNAAGYLISHALNEIAGTAPDKNLEKLKASFLDAAGGKKNVRVAIIDENPWQQNMHLEFLMYQKLFESMGWTCEILDSAAIDPKKFDFVYNRSTDFYLNDPKHAALREAYLKDQIIVSPNPREYFLLADKNRYLLWAESLSDAFLKSHFIPTFGAKSKTPEEIWARRKQLFFKPRNSYGGKSVYKAESVSRKVFDRVIFEDFLVQEFVPPGEMGFDGDPHKWKFDLRFYVYKNQIQSWCARLYHGQVTNFKTVGGGFCPVIFK